MPLSDPRPRASIWGKYWTVGHNKATGTTNLTLYDAVPMPRMDFRLTPAELIRLIHDLRGDHFPPPFPLDDQEQEPQPMVLPFGEEITVNNSTVLVPMKSLAFICRGGERYKVRYTIIPNSESVTPGFKLGFIDSYPDAFGNTFSVDGYAQANSENGPVAAQQVAFTTVITATSGVPTFITVEAMITTSNPMSLILLGFAQQTATAEDCTIENGTNLVLDRIS